MRVLLISRCPPYPLHLGDRLILWHLARELGALGVEVDLLAFTQTPHDADDVPHYRHLFGSVQLLPEAPRPLPSIAGRALFASRRFPQDAQHAWSPEMWHAIQAQMSAQSYAVVHLFGGIHVYEFWHALKGHPALITPYESYSLYMARHLQTSASLSSLLRYRLAQRYEAFMFAPYPAVTVLAQPDADELQRLNPRYPMQVIPNGVDLAYFAEPSLPRQTHSLLFVGNYEYAPNLDAAYQLLDDIFPPVRAQFPQAHLWIVGHAPPPELRARADEQIHITGRVDDVRPYYAQTSAFVAPLRIGAGIKNKVLEALAMRACVLTTPIGADGIALEHGTHALIAEPEQLATTLLALWRDDALQARLHQHSRPLIEQHYSWHSVAQCFLALYQRLSRQTR